MGERINREVFSHGGGRDRGAPVQREVEGRQTSSKVSCRVEGPEGGQGGEGGGKSRGGGVVSGWGTSDPEGG